MSVGMVSVCIFALATADSLTHTCIFFPPACLASSLPPPPSLAHVSVCVCKCGLICEGMDGLTTHPTERHEDRQQRGGRGGQGRAAVRDVPVFLGVGAGRVCRVGPPSVVSCWCSVQ